MSNDRVGVLHFVDLPVENPWLNGVATHHDRTRFRHLVVSLGPRSALHEAVESRGLETFALGARHRRHYPTAVARLVRILRSRRVDILQTHLFWPSLLGLAAGSLAGTPVKLVTRHHSDFTTTFHHPIHRQLDRLQAHWADQVLGASQAVKRDMLALEHVPKEKVTVARYGYDFGHLRPRLGAAERRRLREELGGDDLTIVATVARLSPSKGHRFLFEAIPAILGDHPRSVFLLAGTGPLRDELEALARQLNISDRVRFLGWRSDAADLIEASDLVVHPTLHEAFCSLIIETMALERPLVATDVAAAPEQVDHGRTGLLVPARNPGAIASAVKEVLGDRLRAERMGREARRAVVERFNFPRMMRIYEEIYDGFRERLPRDQPRSFVARR